MISNRSSTSNVQSVPIESAPNPAPVPPEDTSSSAEQHLPSPSRRSSDAAARSRVLANQASRMTRVSVSSNDSVISELETSLRTLFGDDPHMRSLSDAVAEASANTPPNSATDVEPSEVTMPPLDARVEHMVSAQAQSTRVSGDLTDALELLFSERPGNDESARTAESMLAVGLELAHAVEEGDDVTQQPERRSVTADDVNRAFAAIEIAEREAQVPVELQHNETRAEQTSPNTDTPQADAHIALAQRNIEAALATLPGWRANIARNHPVLNVGANYVTSLGRDGTITAMSTFARELIGYGVENWDKLTDERRVALSYAVMAMAIGLNTYSMARQHFKGTANNTTRVSQATNLALIIMALTLAAKTNTLGGVSSLLVKGLIYSIVRDSANTFVLLNDAMDTSGKPPNLKSMFSNVSTYTTVSTIVNYLQSLPGVNSGTSDQASALGLGKAIKGIIPFALANALGEGADGVHLPYWQALYDSKRSGVDAGGQPKEPRRNASDVVMVTKWRVPSMEQYLDKVTGLMNGRIAFFMVAYGLVGVINNAGIKNPAAAMAFSNVMLGFITGAFCPIFGGGAATSSPRPRHSEESAV